MNLKAASRSVETLNGIGQIADRYDGFIVDLWGVIYDGLQLYPGIVETLTRMRAEGRVIGLLSNAPTRIEAVAKKLDGLGLPKACWDYLLTSGEASHQALIDRSDPAYEALGDRVFLLGGPLDGDVLENVPGLSRVDRFEEASFVLVTGIDRPDRTMDSYEERLSAIRALGLTMLCANPDLIVNSGKELKLCAGSIADRYEQLGGHALYQGKPHAPVYHRLISEMGSPGRILAIGDSFRTDIAGANGVGLDSLLITGGIHAAELEAPDGIPHLESIKAVAREIGVWPGFAMSRLAW